ncbi:MAG: AbrB/MazE/SpoVT family DNA-binding domain-containing protein [Bacteroidetes bacterium]|nr:AbrB/MazE/SpoVT family DNA-binding domain-containing protein [Bacteroidota bacterium]
MPTVKVSPKYQVVIPREVREVMDIKPGQKVEVMVYDNRIVLIPIKPMKEMRGYVKGVDTTIVREPDREL